VAIEHDAKILGVDPDLFETMLHHLGAERVSETRLMRRYVYDITPGDASKWIRLRDTGREVTLTIKQIVHDGIDGTHETEVVVDDFETTNALLGMLGFTPKAYQENRRTSFLLEGAQVELDEWPLIPPYVEIEAGSKDEVVRVAALLGVDASELTGENTTKVYARYGIDLSTIKDLRFQRVHIL
jgi:adenylate cyclase class 2